jgi:5-oxoprolinase (ATP-hydrolysing) subunit C
LNPHLFVEAPGLSTTVQDLGRFGHQHLGMPVSGALDHIALRIGNALVGNPQGTAALEIRMQGPTLRVEAESIRVALTGTSAHLEILDATGRAAAPWESVRLKQGQRFRIGSLRDTSCCYLAIEGGFAISSQFGSLSTYARGNLGGFEGRALQHEDKLPLCLGRVQDRDELRLRNAPTADERSPVRVVLGPQNSYFTAEAVQIFLEAAFTVSHQADRMGVRLEGPALSHARGFNIVSDGIATGAVQVPGTGKPIILLADHQTTGGYPKLAVVASVDLPRLGRMMPGNSLRFREVPVEEAEEAKRSQERSTVELLAKLEPVRRPGTMDVAQLLEINLISGFVSADE